MHRLLAACFCLLFLAAADAAATEFDYAGAKRCKSCHGKEPIGNQYASWLDTKHAKAYETLASDKAREWAAEAGVDDPQQSEKCVKCHVTAYGVAPERLGSKFKIEDGVQCEGCHGAGNSYRKKKIMMDRDRAVEKGLVLQSEEICVACHNDESPAWDPERYTLEDGTQVGFDYDQAVEAIAHPVPEGYDPTAEGEAD
ncbi:MAG: cytochrome c family protein [Deltaproteobacteria bacterium]|nr:MAG: cytochrome c family protein [Deltaproteobacteria bacterium]